MSKRSTSAIPAAPQASRRTLLIGLAAAATPLAPALANALSEPAPATADPIFAVIAEHVAATKAYVASCHADTATTDLMERSHDAWLAVMTAQPTTVQGVAALLEHVGRSEFLGEEQERSGLVETETVLSSWINGTDPEHEFAIAARTFESRLGETLRNIIERGRA
jgi:hypothetical protein